MQKGVFLMKDEYSEPIKSNIHDNKITIKKGCKFIGFDEFNQYCDSAADIPSNAFDTTTSCALDNLTNNKALRKHNT